MTDRNFKVVTYNLHGLNQGLPFLQELLLNSDIVCVQEHWLSSVDCSKLNINTDFTVIASYALDDVIGKGVLRGRPFGGLALFVRNSLIQNLTIICKTDRLVVLKMNNCLIFNVYMPCNDRELFTSILGTISYHINNMKNNFDYC